MKVPSTVQFARGAAADGERWTIFVPETSKHFTIGRVEASVIARFAPDRRELDGLEPAAVAPEAVDAFVARLKELRVLVDRDPAPARRVRLLGFPEWNP